MFWEKSQGPLWDLRALRCSIVPKLHGSATRLFSGGGLALLAAFTGFLVELALLHFRDQSRILNNLLEALERVLDRLIFF